ncbi:GntR family transcriptional regulator [Tistrella mobilis]|jgi:hypothetical protein|uniref:GntR family transcriptional regulator n=1 Tax=Tistrella mobilis TaxID=171437 RepID=UPI0035589ED2
MSAIPGADLRFIVHDMSAFPLVRARPDAVRPGYAVAWEEEMQALLDRGTPFVVIFSGPQPEETHEDRRRRALWLKRSREVLGLICKGMIVVEESRSRRLVMEAQALMAEKAFGVPARVVASEAGVEEAARDLLARG